MIFNIYDKIANYIWFTLYVIFFILDLSITFIIYLISFVKENIVKIKDFCNRKQFII